MRELRNRVYLSFSLSLLSPSRKPGDAKFIKTRRSECRNRPVDLYFASLSEYTRMPTSCGVVHHYCVTPVGDPGLSEVPHWLNFTSTVETPCQTSIGVCQSKLPLSKQARETRQLYFASPWLSAGCRTEAFQ